MYFTHNNLILHIFFAVFFMLWFTPTAQAVAPLIPDANGHLVITPEHIQANGELRIEGTPGLTSLTISGTLTDLRWLNIDGNNGLTSLTISGTLPALTKLTVASNYRLTSLTIPDTLTALTELNVASNYRLTSLTIPDTLTALTELNVSGNNGLTSLTIPGTPPPHGPYNLQS